MEDDIEKIINIIQKQAEAFLLKAREFFPFGIYINKKGEIIPVGGYVDNEYAPSVEVIDLLEKTFKSYIQKGNCRIAIIAIDVTVRKNNRNYDAVELRFFEPYNEVYKKYLSYIINDDFVEFSDLELADN